VSAFLATVAALRARVWPWRAAGTPVALVPTMGNLHDGHLKLIEVARARGARTVVSVFVNPTQFDRVDDFTAYPRTLEQDGALAQRAGADALFVPDVTELYPNGTELRLWVDPGPLGGILEGEHRPGHFRGVATVVAKLFNAVQPDLAVFGEKDYQQLTLMRMLARELLWPLEIVGVPTVRAPDGLALSSRNAYLTPAERARAPQLHAALQAAAAGACTPGADLDMLAGRARDMLTTAGFQVDYVCFCDAQCRPPAPEEGDLVVLAAAWLGRARLIDSLPLRRDAP
jgi:pantoate--beta-alanine ligase